MMNDAEAVYPLRIDPTFSDADWVSMGGFPGANGTVHAAVRDGSGNLYIGGEFTIAGNTIANYIAQWNGGAVGPPSVRGCQVAMNTAPLCLRWRCRDTERYVN
jgi:hypothetical protein